MSAPPLVELANPALDAIPLGLLDGDCIRSSRWHAEVLREHAMLVRSADHGSSALAVSNPPPSAGQITSISWRDARSRRSGRGFSGTRIAFLELASMNLE